MAVKETAYPAVMGREQKTRRGLI